MENVAGKENPDEILIRELTRARVEVVELPRPLRRHPEVHAGVGGRIGHITLHRAWYYWIAEGKVDYALAEKLYADPIGRTDVRVGGHCGCPSPAEYGTAYFHEDGSEILVDPDGSEQRVVERYPHLFVDKRYTFVKTKEERVALAAKRFVDCYHIDSEVGLRLFADMIREGAS